MDSREADIPSMRGKAENAAYHSPFFASTVSPAAVLGTVTKKVSARTVPLCRPEWVFSDGKSLFLSSGLRYLTKYDAGDELTQQAHFDFGQDGVKAFAGYDRESRMVWAVSHRANRLMLFDENLTPLRTVTIPKNEGIFFSHSGEQFFIDSYNPPFTVYRLSPAGLAPLPVALPGSPFAREFLAVAYGYPFPVFHYYASRILMAFDGVSFRRVGRVHGVDGPMQGSVALFGSTDLSLTMSNDSTNYFQTMLSVLDRNMDPLQHIEVTGVSIGSSFCVAENKILIMSHQHSQLYVIPLDALFDPVELA